MRRGTRRALLIGLVAAVVIAAAFLSGSLWLVGTQPGAKFAFEQLGAYLPGKLEVGSVEGPIRGPLVVHRLRFTSDRIHVSIERLSLDWSLRWLAFRRLDIRRLEADSVNVALVLNKTPAPRDTAAPELPDVDLPLDVLIGHGRIRSLVITPAGSDSGIPIDEVALTETAFRDTLSIGSLDILSRRGEVHIAGRARPRGRYAVDLASRWILQPKSGPPVTGSGRFVGSLDTLTVFQRVGSPFQGTLELTAYRPMKNFGFQAKVSFTDLVLRQLGPTLPEGRYDGRIEAGGDFDAFNAGGTIDAITPRWGRVRTTFQAERRDSTIRIDRVTAQLGGRGTVVARGTLIAGAVPRFDLRGDWRDLSLSPTGSPLRSARGDFHVAGTPSRYRLQAGGVVTHPALAEVPWKVNGSGTPRGLAVSSLEARPLGGNVTGSGKLDWSASLSWEAKFAARDIQPGRIQRELPGSVGFDAVTRGRARGGSVDATIDVSRLSGTLRGRPIAGHASLASHPDGWSIPEFDVAWGANHVTAKGEMRRTWNLEWAVNAADLTAVHSDLAGSMRGQGTLRGTGSSRRIAGSLTADSLAWRDLTLDHLEANGDVAAFGRDPGSHLDVVATGGGMPGRAIQHSSLALNGSLAEHDLRFEATSGPDSVRLTAHGGWAHELWSGRLQVLDVISKDWGTWGLEREAGLVAGTPRIEVRDFRWRSGASLWSADGDWRRDGPWTFDSHLENLGLDRIQPVLPRGVAMTGPLGGEAHVSGTGARWTGDLTLRAGPGEMTWAGEGARRGRTPIDSVLLRIRSRAGGTGAILAASLGTTGTLRGEGTGPAIGPRGVPGDGPVRGAVEMRVRDLGLVQAILPDITNVRGTLDGDLTIGGTTQRVLWSGSAKLAGGQADVPRLGIGLRDVHFEASGDPRGRLLFDGGAHSGPGQLRLEGELGVTADGHPHVRASLLGDRFLAMNNGEGRVLISPVARVRLSGDSLRLRGDLVVPEAELREPKRSHPVVTSSQDVVFVGTDSLRNVKKHPLQVDAEVRLVLGDRVRVLAYGLDARATGSVDAIEQPDAPITGSGELRLVDGHYRAYGRNLTVDRGRLIFAGGPIVNPGLDVRATRRARDGVVAGFEVSGTLQSPSFQVVSDPPMAQRDALGYVVFGRKPDRASQNQEDIITDAANTLGVSGGSLVAQTLARKFGIDEASLESQGTLEESSLMLGTYVSPRLYVNYGLGVIDAASTLRIQYFLSRMWTLEAEAGTRNSAAQFMYVVERR